MLVQNRTSVPLAEVLTWNDFGESHYVGPIEGIQPMSQGWVNGYDHQGASLLFGTAFFRPYMP